jgi:hypothetical protein
MPNSLNGFPVLKAGSGQLVTKAIPGVKGRRLTMRKDVIPLFLALAHDYHYWISALNVGPVDEGGYAYRQARAGGGWSNHSSGTAADLNWSMEGSQASTMGRTFFAQPEVSKAIRTIDAIYGDVIDWGGRWRAEDFMHWEIAPGASLAEVKALITHLGINANGVRTRNAMGEPITPRN